MRMKWLPAGIGLFLIGMSVVSFAGERVYEQAEFPHEICGTWTDIHGGRTLEITPRAVDGDILDGMYDVAGGGVKGAVKAVLLREGQPVTEQISWNVMSPNYKILVYGNQPYYRLTGRHFESVDGIYLGMEMEEVRQLYGEPDRKDGTFPYLNWSYEKEGVSVYFYGGIVDGIWINKGSRKTFDRSGLNADSPRDSYAAYYKMGGPMNEFFTAGEDESEYISLYEDRVCLGSGPY